MRFMRPISKRLKRPSYRYGRQPRLIAAVSCSTAQKRVSIIRILAAKCCSMEITPTIGMTWKLERALVSQAMYKLIR